MNTITEERLRQTAKAEGLRSKPFAESLVAALERGDISVRRAASMCGLVFEELDELFATHGIKYVVEL